MDYGLLYVQCESSFNRVHSAIYLYFCFGQISRSVFIFRSIDSFQFHVNMNPIRMHKRNVYNKYIVYEMLENGQNTTRTSTKPTKLNSKILDPVKWLTKSERIRGQRKETTTKRIFGKVYPKRAHTTVE